MRAKPFIKCAGGKTQILDEIEKRLPERTKRTKKIERYIEPFLGGGAVFFYLQEHYQINSAILIDKNQDLILTYKVVQKYSEELIGELEKIENEYFACKELKRDKYYYQIRREFNQQRLKRCCDNLNRSCFTRAAHFIFLNKTCFNGLFRQNLKGEFNVPFGRYVRPAILNRENLLAVSQALKKVTILDGDFSQAENYAKKNTLVYLDPPYRPLNTTSKFTHYLKSGFDDNEQIRLAEFFKKMYKEGAYLILSNSDPQNRNPNDKFFDELYGEFLIERIQAKRAINRKGQNRGKINELIIRNFVE